MLCFRCGSYNVDDASSCSVCGQEIAAERVAAGPGKTAGGTKLPAGIFTPGELIGGKYKILDVIGQGGVGTVYRARDTELEVELALKAIAPNLLQTEEEQSLFAKMMRQARKLHHQNIIRIYDEGAEENRRFFTMKLLEGLTLRKIIRLRHDKGQSFSPEEITPIFHQLGSALDYAHKSTWHGDLKPENVIILPDLLKVTDFNLVKGLPLKPFLGIAKSRSKGFPYISPELRVEASEIDGRADIYSLGVILAEMLTGLVYEGHFTRAMTAALEQLPTKLDGLVRRSVSEHPDGRFPKASEMAKELDKALAGLSGPLPSPAGGMPPPRPVGRPAGRPVQPPPPPEETNPGEVPGVTDSHEALQRDDSLEEIGQSQVHFLGGQGADEEAPPTETSDPSTVDQDLASPPREERADEVMRNMPPPPLEGDDDEEETDAGPRPRAPLESEKAPRKPPLPKERVIDSLYADDDQLVPPPLPEHGLDASDSFDLPEGVSVRSSSSRDGEDEETLPDLDEVGIHEELTALKPHPRPEVQRPAPAPSSSEDDAEKDNDFIQGSDEETITRHLTPVSVEERRDKKEPPATASREEIAVATERSSPRLHAAEPLSPPVISPRASGAYVPPGLRPVSPPARKKSAAGLYVGIIAAAVVIVALVLWGTGGDDDDDREPEVAATEPRPAEAPSVPVDEEEPDEAAPPPPVEPEEPDAPDEAEEPEEEVAAVAAPSPTDPVEPPAPDPAAERDRLAALEEERRREEEARRRQEEKRASETDRLARLEAERAAAEARKRAEQEDARRRAQETKKPEPERPDEKLAAVAATPKRGTKCPPGMQLLPSGSFTLGSTSSDPMRNFGEKLATRTEVAGYCIDYYEFPNSSARVPTTGVSWVAAKRACERKGRRLCTEAEWERACKGPRQARFPYGNGFNVDRCNTEDASGNPRELKGAKAFPRCRSGFGVYALSGNAEEWVADSFRSGASSRTVKGGGADRPDWASRCAARRGLAPGTKKATLGFRCCADPE